MYRDKSKNPPIPSEIKIATGIIIVCGLGAVIVSCWGLGWKLTAECIFFALVFAKIIFRDKRTSVQKIENSLKEKGVILHNKETHNSYWCETPSSEDKEMIYEEDFEDLVERKVVSRSIPFTESTDIYISMTE